VDRAYVFDRYAQIAHFEDEAGGNEVRKILKAASAGKTEIFLSVINLGELYSNTLRERKREKAEEVLFLVEQLPIHIVNADLACEIMPADVKAYGHRFPAYRANRIAVVSSIRFSFQCMAEDAANDMSWVNSISTRV
jgi:predicted nucleic acid-binding protein